jgi:hypothetical protein
VYVYAMEILDLFIVALMPVLKTLLVTAVGLLLAVDRIGLLGPDARHHLNNVSFLTSRLRAQAPDIATTNKRILPTTLTNCRGKGKRQK